MSDNIKLHVNTSILQIVTDVGIARQYFFKAFLKSTVMHGNHINIIISYVLTLSRANEERPGFVGLRSFYWRTRCWQE